MDVTDGADAEAVKAASEDTDVQFDPWAKNGIVEQMQNIFAF